MTAAQTISQLLQANWSLTNPDKADILWTDIRFEAVDFAKLGKNIVVACYSPTSPTLVTPLSREAWQEVEQVIIDIIVKNTGNVQTARDLREAMRNEIYRIIHSKEFAVEGYDDVGVTREPYKVESPDLTRLTIQVACVCFKVIA